MVEKLTLGSAISECADALSGEGVEFDSEDVFRCLSEKFADVIGVYSDRLTRAAINRQINQILKRKAGQDPGEEYEQLALAGFDNAPRNVPFYDGKRVRYIGSLHATESHLLSAIKLRRDNIAFCVARVDDYERMIDFLRHSGKRTFGEAVSQAA